MNESGAAYVSINIGLQMTNKIHWKFQCQLHVVQIGDLLQLQDENTAIEYKQT